MKWRHDWTERHAEFIESRYRMPFAWGTNDCAMFYCDAMLFMTDYDLGAPWRGYSDERGALRIISENGGLRALARSAGIREKDPRLANRQNGVLCNMAGRETFGLVVGNGYWCAPGEKRLEMRPMSEAIVALELV